MAFDDTLIVEHLRATHDTELLSDREKHLVGLAVTMTRGCQICTQGRIGKARASGLSDDHINALIAVTASINSGVTAATARVAFGLLDDNVAEDCGDTCAPTSPAQTS